MAAINTPDTVAMGTLRSGSSTTAAATDALSSPVNAQKTSTSECGMASMAGIPLTFHDARNNAGSNQNQPATATNSSGTRPAASRGPSTWPTKRGLTMLTKVTSQSSAIVIIAACAAAGSMPKKAARYDDAA